MEAALRGGGKIIEREVAVGHAVEAVRGSPVETERVRGPLAVDREAGAGERRAPERVYDVLSIDASVRSRTSYGGTAPERVREQIAAAKDALGL